LFLYSKPPKVLAQTVTKKMRAIYHYDQLPKLRVALDDYVQRGVTTIDYNEEDAA